MRKSNKKGFTIVELVIVIAIIAILAAVLIPTFAGLIQKANESKDTQLVKNLNTALAADNKEHKTMTDALDAAAAFGYDVGKINASATGKEILWDSENDVFCYYDNASAKPQYIPETTLKNSNVATYKLWKIYNKASDVPNAENQTFSIYWNSNENFTNTLTVGFDAGNCKNALALTYNNTGNAKDVVIRTNGGTLTVNDKDTNGKVYHFGTLAVANITTDTNCFYSYGQIASMTLKAGKVVVSNDGIVSLNKVTPDDGATVEVIKEGNGILYIPEGTSLNDIQLSETNLEALGYFTSGAEGSQVINANEETKSANAYKISSKEELIQFRKDWNSGKVIATVPILLTADIDITGYQWGPIGNWEYPFNGIFDGGNHKIIGLTATTGAGEEGVYSTGDSTGYGEVFGLFGIVGNGDITIKNLSLTKVNIELTHGQNVGALIGYAPDNGNFTDSNKGGTYAPGKWTGNSTIGKGSIHINNVTVGEAGDESTITANKHVAGFIGKTYAMGAIVELVNCTNNANISATTGGFTGGLIGIITNNNALTLKNCVNNGDIDVEQGTGTNGAAGLVGRPKGAEPNPNLVVKLEDCTNNGNITIPSNTNACGLINFSNGNAKQLIIKNCSDTSNSGMQLHNASSSIDVQPGE